jgi:hypothetical protein
LLWGIPGIGERAPIGILADRAHHAAVPDGGAPGPPSLVSARAIMKVLASDESSKTRQHESSRKLREEEIIADNLFLSQFPERLPGRKRKPSRKKEARRRHNRCRNDRFSRSNRFCACPFWERRHEEVSLTTVRSAGRRDGEGWARAGLRGAKPLGAQNNTGRPARVWRERYASG